MPAFTQYSTGLKLVTQVQEVRRSSIKISIQKNWNAGPSPKLFNFIYNTLATFNYLLLVSIPGQYTCLCGSSQNYYSSSGNERDPHFWNLKIHIGYLNDPVYSSPE